MPKQNPFLYRRGNVLAFRIVVPVELRPFVGCRELTKSLRTSDKHLALPLALELAAKAKRLFYDLRKIMSDISNKKNMEIRMRVAAEEIKLRWVKENHEEEITKLNEINRQERKVQDAIIETYRSTLGAFSQQAPVANNSSEFPQCHTQSKINAPAAQEYTSDSAPAVNTPMHRLSEIIPIWISENTPAKSTISAFTFSVSRFESVHPNLYVETIEQEHINDFIKHLQSQNLNSRTIKKDHSFIRALFTIALSKKWVKSNPAIGASLPKKIKTSHPPVRGYKVDELKLIFNSPVFASNERPTAGKGEAAYWIPLLLLFTGARREELCQLTTDRVRCEDGINIIDIDAMDDDGQLKTAGSIRLVPIHDGLIKLGFLDFVSKMRNSGGSNMLFPLLERNARGQYGQKWGDWWGKYMKRTIGIVDEQISPAHSFRHTFITECRRARIGDDARAITGHTLRKLDDHDQYGISPIDSLAESINKITFKGLDLSHLPQAKVR